MIQEAVIFTIGKREREREREKQKWMNISILLCYILTLMLY
jgi:hypothetical protein